MITAKDSTSAVLAGIGPAAADALSAVGEAAVSHARVYVPVDTGRLRDSIGYTVSGNVLAIGTSVPYAGYVELGVLGRPGAHYLRNAAACHEEEYAAILSSVFVRGMMKGGE